MLPIATNKMNNNIVKIIFDLKQTCLIKEERIINELKLSPSEYRGLLSVNPGEVVSCMQISNTMGLSKSRGSRVIDKLIDNGFLKEAKIQGDKRVFNVKLTLKGISAVKNINSIMKECENAILKNISSAELAAFTKTLHKISEILRI